ncbi:hypothetical protein V8F20_005635 [Naviculisporaceae sp. PSN 640]
MHQEPAAAGPERLPTEAASNKSPLTSSSSPPSSSSRAIPIPQSRESIYLRRDKDIAPVSSVLRTDSIDSYKIRRSDTTFSTRTDFTAATELDPPSPGVEDFHDGPMILDDTNHETYASSPRPFSRTVTFYQDNCRPEHRSSSPDNNPLPVHSDIRRRLQNRSSSPKRGILRTSTGFNPSRPGSLARRESSQWPGTLALRTRPNRWTIAESDDTPSGLQKTPELPTPTEPTPTEAGPAAVVVKAQEHPDSGMIRQIQQDDTAQELSSVCMDHTPIHQAEPEEMSDSSDSVGDIRTPSSTASGSKPDDQMVQDTCDQVLRNVFGVDLQELGVTDAASAYNSVHYCLDELSQIVPAENSVSQSSPAFHQVPNYGTTRGGGNTPIRPGNGGDYSSYQIGGGTGGGRSGQKRPNGDGDQGDQPGQNGNGGGSGSGGRDSGGGGKRPKTAPAEPSDDQKLSCPFRKRNPVKFNVRDHQSCAVQSFPDISQLKRHVKNFHRQRSVAAFGCPRCKQDMIDKESLEYHLAVPSEVICTPPEAPLDQNPEDGITSRIEDLLNGRKANTKIDTWEVLWPTLFPADTVIPDSRFVPPVELEEVHSQFEQHMHDLESRIREAEQNASDYSQSPDDRVAMVLASCRQHIEYVFEMSRLQADSGPGRPRRIRSHGHGPNPKSSKKGKSPDTGGLEKLSRRTVSPIALGRQTSEQHSSPPEPAEPQPIPKKLHGQRLSVGESNLSCSPDTANSDGSWVHTPHQQPGGQESDISVPAQPLDQYALLNLETSGLHSADLDEPLSGLTTGPAGSPAYLVSPSIEQGCGSVIPPPQQAHFRNATENHGLQMPNNGGPSQIPVTSVLASQLLSRTDAAIHGVSATFFRPPGQAFQNPNIMGISAPAPSPFPANPPPMGYGQPTQQMQQMHMLRFREAQAQAQAAAQQQQQQQQHQVPVTLHGGTIDPRMINNNICVVPSMAMGNNGNNGNSGHGHGPHGYDPFSGGGNGTN